MLQVAPIGFIKDLDSLARQLSWAGNLSSSKWCLVKWDIGCKPKQFGGLKLWHSSLTSLALSTKLYWRWCLEQDHV